MALIDKRTQEELRPRLFERLEAPVELTLFRSPDTSSLVLPEGDACNSCDDAEMLARELAALSPDRIRLSVLDSPPGDRRVPALAVGAAGTDPGIWFEGVPAGYEFATVLDAVERVSGGDARLSEGLGVYRTVEHRNRSELLTAPRRIEGQARGVQRMVDGGRPCHEVVREVSALGAADRFNHRLVASNLLACLEQAELECETRRRVDRGLQALAEIRS